MPFKSATWKNIIHPDDLELINKNVIQHCDNENHPYDQTVRYTHQFGQTIWMRRKGMAIRNKEGKPVRMIGIHANVSELKNTQIKLKAQVEFNNQIMESSEIGSWHWDLNSNQFEISNQWASHIGYSSADFSNYTFNDFQLLLHKEDIQGSLMSINTHLEGANIKLEFECRIKHYNGQWIWVLYKGGVIGRNIDGTPKTVSGTQQVIDARKRNELLLLKYKSLTETTNHGSNIGTWEVDLNSMTSYWSNVTKKIHEVPSNFLSTVENGINFYKKGESRDKISNLFNEAVAKAQQFDDVFEIVTAKGNIKYVRAIGVPIVKNGKVVSVNGLFQDVDSETRLNQKLKLQEEQFRQTFEFAAIGIAIVSLDGKWVRVNKSTTKMLGYSEAELIQLTFQDITHPEDLSNDLNLLDQLVNKKIEAYTIEKRYFHKDGNTI
tara:strand:- start:26994 stop:28298 length:1305 start_codon:yes stop_codon:yes gene_type:complete